VSTRYSDTEERNLDIVRQMFGERDGPADRSELFAEDATWWNGLPMIPGAVGQTEHRGIDAIRNILPSSGPKTRTPGVDVYDLSTGRNTDVVMLADGDYVVRQHTFSAKTLGGQDYRNVYCFVFHFDAAGKIAYLTEHWNTWHAHNVLFNNFELEPAHPAVERSPDE
jgi:ketosteroid isomerase-like protein